MAKPTSRIKLHVKTQTIKLEVLIQINKKSGKILQLINYLRRTIKQKESRKKILIKGNYLKKEKL